MNPQRGATMGPVGNAVGFWQKTIHALTKGAGRCLKLDGLEVRAGSFIALGYIGKVGPPHGLGWTLDLITS